MNRVDSGVDQGAARRWEAALDAARELLRSELDANGRLNRLGALFRSSLPDRRATNLEVYQRATLRVRAAREETSAGLSVLSGYEEGTAVRLADDRTGSIAFGSASGSGSRAMEHALAAARAAGPANGVEGRPWSEGHGSPSLDLDAHEGFPSCAILHEKLSTVAAPCWIEAAVTLEAWVADGGLEAARLRSRIWAFTLEPARDGRERAKLAASRRIEDLDLKTGDRVTGAVPPTDKSASGSSRVPADIYVVLAPEAAARAADALVRTLHAPGARSGVSVGAGWRVEDRPMDGEALSGGRFDDAGFTARDTRLADGVAVVGTLGGPGSYRRASFRDPPSPRASHVLVEPPDLPLPPRALVAEDLRLHALGERWLLDLDGFLHGGPSSGAPVRGAMVPVTPGRLARACVGGIGPPRRSALGIVTPALVFDLGKAQET